MSNDAPRPSATVVLMRQGADGIETYLVQRHGRAAFGNAWAFPGGVVEAFDRLLDTPGALNYYSAAIRELFEETGVLLGSARVTSVELDAARDALNDGTITWDDFVRNDGVALDSNALHYVSYWITPAGMPKRFATRFFLARMPEGQTAQHCGRELVGCRWMTTAAALAAYRDGSWRLRVSSRYCRKLSSTTASARLSSPATRATRILRREDVWSGPASSCGACRRRVAPARAKPVDDDGARDQHLPGR